MMLITWIGCAAREIIYLMVNLFKRRALGKERDDRNGICPIPVLEAWRAGTPQNLKIELLIIKRCYII